MSNLCTSLLGWEAQGIPLDPGVGPDRGNKSLTWRRLTGVNSPIPSWNLQGFSSEFNCSWNPPEQPPDAHYPRPQRSQATLTSSGRPRQKKPKIRRKKQTRETKCVILQLNWCIFNVDSTWIRCGCNRICLCILLLEVCQLDGSFSILSSFTHCITSDTFEVRKCG